MKRSLSHPIHRDTEAQAQAAAAAAEVERSERASAEGLSVQLKAEADRRAKVFHNAVKAGVAKVQAELEAERDSLEARCACAVLPCSQLYSIRQLVLRSTLLIIQSICDQEDATRCAV